MANKRRFDKRHYALQKGEVYRSDGIYVYRWTDAFGKRHAISSTDLDELRIKEQKVALNRLEGIKEAPATLTVESLYETWKNLKRGIKASTASGYVFVFDSLIRPSFGKKRVAQLKRTDVRAFYISLLEERGISMGTLDSVHNVLQQVLQYAVDDDILRKNPCDRVLKEIKVSYTSMKSAKKQALTMKQEINFLQYLYENERYKHWFPTFFIMANTGLRVGELTGLRWQDVDLENGTIDVNHTLYYFNHRDEKGSYLSITTPKTENGYRKVALTKAVKDAFLMEKAYQELAGIKSIDEIDGYDGFIFINRFGHVQHQGTLNKALRRIIRDFNVEAIEAGKTDSEDILPHFSCHILRHTFATRLMESGVSLKYLSGTLGHSEIQTTMDIYVSKTDEFSQRENKTFEDYMKTSFLGSTDNKSETMNTSSLAEWIQISRENSEYI